MSTMNEERAKSKDRQTLLLKGLCCAGCAVKIEAKVKDIDAVSYAYLDFTTQKLVLETEQDLNKWEEIVEKVKKIVESIEPDVEVIMHGKHHIKTEEKEKMKFRKKDYIVVIGFIVFAVSFLFSGTSGEVYWFAAAYVLIGYDIILKAFKNIMKKEVFDENFLMVIATMGAFAIREFPEAVSVMIFYKIGEFFQDKAVEKSRKSIVELMNIRPDYAVVEIDGVESRTSPESVKKGDIIIVKPGEKIPMDGVVYSGMSSVDTASLTGESIPRDVFSGSEVLGGFVNKNGVLKIVVSREFAESTASKILELVENAVSKKSKTENFITKFARYYTPAVVLIAALITFVPSAVWGWQNGAWLYRSLIFLVVSCPCALVVSIPLGFFGGIGGASRKGILIKGGNYLEALNNVGTVVFDKTGTLTKGKLFVENVKTASEFLEKELLEYAAAAETYSSHPIAESIRVKFGNSIDKTKLSQYNEIAGKGIKVLYKENEIAIGNHLIMKDEHVEISHAEQLGTIVYVAVNGKFAGYIVIKDEIKEDAANAIKSLREVGVKRIVMLTGDNKKNAEETAKKLGIDEYYAELLPHDKVAKIEEIEKNGSYGKTIFVGDGINDAPVLARADIGIAMGGIGSDAAIEASDVVIMNDELSKIAEAIKISKKTRKIVWQNITLAMGVKSAVLIIGVLGMATMWEAVFADVGVALVAVFNAMRVIGSKNEVS